MEMLKWARKEVEIAIKKERKEIGDDIDEKEFEYIKAIYDSALKAYESLLGDNHTGYSISFTKYILNRLLDDKPLSPITKDDKWIHISTDKDTGFDTFQSIRMGSLFKNVYTDGKVEYTDLDRFVAIDIHSMNAFHFSVVSKIMDEMFPLELPYNPNSRPFKVYCEDFLVNPDNGDFDTIGIFSVLIPTNDTKIDIYRYFATNDDSKEWSEITKEQYESRLKLSKEVKNETETDTKTDAE